MDETLDPGPELDLQWGASSDTLETSNFMRVVLDCEFGTCFEGMTDSPSAISVEFSSVRLTSAMLNGVNTYRVNLPSSLRGTGLQFQLQLQSRASSRWWTVAASAQFNIGDGVFCTRFSPIYSHF